jgi:tetratricopeptide (TPR) repeat protein
VDTSFESRVWQKALDRGLLSTRQVNDCLKESDSTAPTLRLTEVLVAKGYLNAEQVTEIRGQLATSEPEAPEEVRAAARDPRKLIGRYVILEELGRGGMGIVYKAWDGDLRRFVALKVLSGPWDEEDLARFRREAQSAASLRHPNIITVYEISPSDESPYISLELIDGRTLNGKKLTPRKAAELMIVIARAVEVAHRRGIIHRDLKPHNIMIDAEGRPRVMDFGLAKPVRSSSQITMSGTIVGTPAYMSPEQAQGRHREVDQRSDIFSLGAMLYELITGKTPFGGKTPLETLTAVVNRNPISPRKLAPAIPRPLEAVILTCLHKDKTRRYSSSEALARDLERFLKGEKVLAKIPVSPGRLIFALSAGIAFAAGLFALWRPEPRPAVPLPPPPPPAPVARVVDRTRLLLGQKLLDDAKLDPYRAGVNLATTQTKLADSERCFDAALKIDPESGAAFLGRGEARSRLNRQEAALSDFAEAVRRMPASPAVYLARGRVLLEHFLRELGLASWMKSDLPEIFFKWREQARADFRKARELSPSRNDLSYLEACLAYADDQYDRAIELASLAMPTAEHPEEFYKLRGDAYAVRSTTETDPAFKASSMKKSLEDYGQAITLRANYTDAYRTRGAMLWVLGRADEAFADFQAVLAMNPEDSRALSDIGSFHHHANQLEMALGYFTRAIAADGRNFRALTNRGSMLLQRNQVAEARKDLEEALKLNPHHLATQFNLAVAVYKQGERGDALRRLDEILARTPKFAKALVIRGVIHYEGGQWKEALEDCERAQAIDPSSVEGTGRTVIENCRKRLGR